MLLSMLRRSLTGGSTNPLLYGYSRLIKADMSKLGNSLPHVWEMTVVGYTLYSCYGSIQGTEISTLQCMGVIAIVMFIRYHNILQYVVQKDKLVFATSSKGNCFKTLTKKTITQTLT
uniref:Uncharacterized protein n=1 Tax=Lactuca sativa TaxID=4236 RepID=A0A9R1WZ42_LACSA|nr:hypothetical protein LSAT_V11C800406550 [Lactuca sativa]